MTSINELCPHGGSGDTCGPLMTYDRCICRLEQERDEARAVLVETADRLAVLPATPADYDALVSIGMKARAYGEGRAGGDESQKRLDSSVAQTDGVSGHKETEK